uniref:Ovule protein n=1 Tax=Mesocestoides corti TaxID=53468 RepID=A0A5K3FFQ2_MESCO
CLELVHQSGRRSRWHKEGRNRLICVYLLQETNATNRLKRSKSRRMVCYLLKRRLVFGQQ